MAGLEFVLQQHMVDRPSGEEAGRGRGGQCDCRRNAPSERNADDQSGRLTNYAADQTMARGMRGGGQRGVVMLALVVAMVIV